MISDDDLLRYVADERARSIGFDLDSELSGERERALEYSKGMMSDIPQPTNRSTAMSSDVNDAIETALPDLVEIFVGGDDVVTFTALGAEDEGQARKETEYVTQVVMEQNDGFLLFYNGIKDALQVKTGVWKASWEVKDSKRSAKVPTETAEMTVAILDQEGVEAEAVEAVEGDDGQTTLTINQSRGRARIDSVPPEDFTVARDTVTLKAATYCAMRTRPRAQMLIEQGYDPEKVDKLPEASLGDQTGVKAARDVAAEQDATGGNAAKPLRTVEIVEHYLRIDANEDGKTELWRVVTGGADTILLDKEEVEAIPFAAITPYMVPHRFYGRSLADLLLEIQRIKTALLRMLLDSGYFALNQRLAVNMERADTFTISDLLDNRPGMPIRTKGDNVVTPLGSPGLSFDVTGALEYVSTVAEQRTGIVRNAQGLNPDTLHETADGARQLIGAAQKRIRMIARVFAETGVKDLFLIVHQLLRGNAKKGSANVGGEWGDIDPSAWPERDALKVEIGVGSGGREQDIIAGNQLLQMQAKAVEVQGGLDGPLVNAQGLRSGLVRQTERLGYRNGEQYWTDPKTYKPPEPSPPPEVVKAQMEGQLEQQKAAGQLQLQREKTAAELQMKRETSAAEIDLRRQQLEAEFELEVEKMRQAFQLRVSEQSLSLAQAPDNSSPTVGSDVEVGGEPG